jgi:hypothetical protein
VASVVSAEAAASDASVATPVRVSTEEAASDASAALSVRMSAALSVRVSLSDAVP